MKNLKTFKPIFNYFKQYKMMLIISCIVIFFTNLSYIFAGYLNGSAIESVMNSALKASITYLLIYFTLNIVVDFISRLVYFSLSKIQIKVSRQIGFDTYKKVMSLPSYAFEEMSSGEIINRLTNDTETIVGSIDHIINILSRIISSFIILIYIFFNSWIIGIEIVIFIIIYIFIVKHFSKKLKIYHKETKEKNDEYTALANESVRGIREIKTLGIVKNLYSNVSNIIKSLYIYCNYKRI